MHGWLILDKPVGLGSTQAVGAVKRGLREAGIIGRGLPKLKVGHGGTLDPLATGVLPIAIGEATKLVGRMLGASKTYEFTIGLGVETATLDAEGEVVATSAHRPMLGEIEAVLPDFTGPIDQAPPAYSAIKIDGRRAYDLARAGKEVAMKKRRVTVHSLEISSSLAGERIESVTLTAHVSKGTYVRSLARDIAHALGTVGHVTMLRRTSAGPFGLEQAISLDKWDAAAKARALNAIILPFEAGLDDIPALSLTHGEAEAIRQGRVLAGHSVPDGLYCAYDGETPVALVLSEAGAIRVDRGLNLLRNDTMSKEQA